MGLCSLPSILCLQLSRCNYLKGESREYYMLHKVSTKVVYPIHDLDMRSYMRPGFVEETGDYMYDLIGVSCHQGLGTTGHYYCICKDNVDKEEKWFRYNDTECVKIDEKDVQTPDACLLVYSRKSNTTSAKEVVSIINNLRDSPE